MRRAALYAALAALSFAPAACTTAQLAQAAKTADEVCAIQAADGPVFVALLQANGVRANGAAKTASVVAADCAAVNAVTAPPGAVATQVAVLPAPS